MDGVHQFEQELEKYDAARHDQVDRNESLYRTVLDEHCPCNTRKFQQ